MREIIENKYVSRLLKALGLDYQKTISDKERERRLDNINENEQDLVAVIRLPGRKGYFQPENDNKKNFWFFVEPKLMESTISKKLENNIKIKNVSALQQGQRVYMIFEGDLNPETGNNLNKVYGTTIKDNQKSVIEWETINASQTPVVKNKSVYLDYVGATLTAAAFDKVLPGLGKWLVTLASWLFAISTMISWSYYGEKGVLFLIGEKGIILYKTR